MARNLSRSARCVDRPFREPAWLAPVGLTTGILLLEERLGNESWRRSAPSAFSVFGPICPRMPRVLRPSRPWHLIANDGQDAVLLIYCRISFYILCFCAGRRALSKTHNSPL